MSHIKWAAFKWFIRDSAPNGDGSSSLFYTVNNCFTSITNQPTKKCGLASARWLPVSRRYRPNFDPLYHVHKKHTISIWPNGFMITLLFHLNDIKLFRCNTCIIFTSHIFIYRFWIFEQQLSTLGNQTKMVYGIEKRPSHYFTDPLIYNHIECSSRGLQ